MSARGPGPGPPDPRAPRRAPASSAGRYGCGRRAAVIDLVGLERISSRNVASSLKDGTSLGLRSLHRRGADHRKDDVTDEEVDRRTEEARNFLTEHEWDALIASITTDEIEAEYEARSRSRVGSRTREHRIRRDPAARGARIRSR